jgi:hypothetical protein
VKRHGGLSCSQVLPAPTWKSLVLEDWLSRREAESDLTGGPIQDGAAKRSSLPVSTAATFNYPDGWSDAAR